MTANFGPDDERKPIEHVTNHAEGELFPKSSDAETGLFRLESTENNPSGDSLHFPIRMNPYVAELREREVNPLTLPLLSDDFDCSAPIDLKVKEAAFYWAVAWGDCYVRGVLDPATSDPLPSPIALVAANRLIDRLNSWIESAEAFPQTWDRCEEADYAENIVMGAIESRTDTWTSQAAIELAETKGSTSETISKALVEIRSKIRQFDELLQANVEILKTAIDTPWWLVMSFECSAGPKGAPWWLSESMGSQDSNLHTENQGQDTST